MSSLGLGEIAIILLVAFVVVGPSDLPKVARALGKSIRSLRAMGDELKKEMEPIRNDNPVREISGEISDIKKSMDELNPVTTVKKELSSLNPFSDTNK